MALIGDHQICLLLSGNRELGEGDTAKMPLHVNILYSWRIWCRKRVAARAVPSLPPNPIISLADGSRAGLEKKSRKQPVHKCKVA